MLEVKGVWYLSDSQAPVHSLGNQSLERPQIIQVVVLNLSIREHLLVSVHEYIFLRFLHRRRNEAFLLSAHAIWSIKVKVHLLLILLHSTLA